MGDVCIQNGQSGGCDNGCGGGNTCLSYACVAGYTGGVPIPGQNGVCAKNGSWSPRTYTIAGETQYNIGGQFAEWDSYNGYSPIRFAIDYGPVYCLDRAEIGVEFKLTTWWNTQNANVKGFRVYDAYYPDLFENHSFGDFGSIIGSQSVTFGGQMNRLGFPNYDYTYGIFSGGGGNPIYFDILVDNPLMNGLYWELEYLTGYYFAGGTEWMCPGPQSP